MTHHLLRTAAAFGVASSVLLGDLAYAGAPDEGLAGVVVGQQEAPPTIVPRGLALSLAEEQFDSVNAADVADLLKYAPNSFVRERFSADDAPVVTLRGTNTAQSARTLVLIDGFDVTNLLGNAESFAPRLGIIGPSEVQQLDVAYGPYSARYGGNSMGGVVSVTTLEPTKKDGYATLQTFAMPFAEYGIDETFTGYGFEAGGSWKQPSSPWTARFSVRRTENTSQPMTYKLLTPSFGPSIPVEGAYADPELPTPVFGASSPINTTQNQFRASAGRAFQNGWKLEGAVYGWLTDNEAADPRTFLLDANDQPVYVARVLLDDAVYLATGLTHSVEQRSEYLAGLKAKGSLGEWDTSIKLSRYWIDTQDVRASTDYYIGLANGLGTLDLQDSANWWTLDARTERKFERLILVFGIGANQYNSRQSNYETDNWKLGSEPDLRSASFGSTQSAGVYGEVEVPLTASSSLTVGMRADSWEAYDGGRTRDLGIVVTEAYPKRSDTSVSPKVSFRSQVGAHWSWQLDVGTATRFPTIGELFQGRIDDATRTLDPNSFDPNLKPEQSYDGNLVLRGSFARWRLTSSLFYQEVEDAIYNFAGLNQFGNLVTNYKNIDSFRQFGLELVAEATDVFFDGLDVDISVARIDARTVRNSANPAAEDQQFPQIPDWRATAMLRYEIAPRMKASLGYRYASQPNSDLFGLSRGDAYGLQSARQSVDARVTWRMSDAIEASLGVDNLTNNQAYAPNPLAQRTGFVAVKVQF